MVTIGVINIGPLSACDGAPTCRVPWSWQPPIVIKLKDNAIIWYIQAESGIRLLFLSAAIVMEPVLGMFRDIRYPTWSRIFGRGTDNLDYCHDSLIGLPSANRDILLLSVIRIFVLTKGSCFREEM